MNSFLWILHYIPSTLLIYHKATLARVDLRKEQNHMFEFLRLLNLCLFAPDYGWAGGGGGGTPGEGSDDGGTDEKKDQGTPEEKDLQIETLKTKLDQLEKANSSKDKSVTKLTKEIEDLKKSLMSEDEKKAAEEKERQQKESEERNGFLNDVRVLAAERAGLEEKDAALIPGNTPEEIRENGKRIKELLTSQFSAGYEKAKKEGMNGGTPQGGSGTPTAGSTKKLNDLFKN